jgi:hypothetical protein
VTVVGVHPASELRARSRLFSALAQAFPVRFEPVEPGVAAPDAVVAFGEGPPGDLADGGPAKRFLATAASGRARRCTVRFGAAPALDGRLRGRSLVETGVAEPSVSPRGRDVVLAAIDDAPVWLRRSGPNGVTDVVGCAPEELADGEPLRDRLEGGRFLGLLPLVHFLREICSDSMWQTQPPRVSFVVDDPNLHWPSYGYLRYPELVRHARAHLYHVAMAMVPADGWYADARSVRLFRENGDVLSLCVHGNDHRRHELGRPETRDEAQRVVAQAVRRIAAFRRRTGLAVSPVMVPPHESCSAESMGVMLELGFEAATFTRPYPWMPFGPSDSPYSTPVPGHVLSGWAPAELMPDGFPVLVRREFTAHDDIVLRSFLDQPVVLYGHVSDFAEGLDALEAAAAVVNSLPGTRWGSLVELAAGNFEHRRRGDVLEIRPFARRIRVSVDPGVTQIRLRPPPRVDGFGYGVVVASHGDDGPPPAVAGDLVLLRADREGTTTVTIEWRRAREVAPETVRRPGLGGRALARRLLTEGRDRATPLLRRARGYASGAVMSVALRPASRLSRASSERSSGTRQRQTGT